MTVQLLDTAQMAILADALGDSPMTVIDCHSLRLRQCKAWTLGSPETFTAAVIQRDAQPAEPDGYGRPEGIWEILRTLSPWTCVDVPADAAKPLAVLMEAELGAPVRLYGDPHHMLRRPVRAFTHPAVRLFGPDDIEFMKQALPPELGSAASFAANIGWAIHAGAVIEGKIVADACTSHRTGGFANISVDTCAPYRNRGYCTAAASLVARAVQQAGEIPVWSAGEENGPSLRVARKLGFERIGRKVYVNRSGPSAEAASTPCRPTNGKV